MRNECEISVVATLHRLEKYLPAFLDELEAQTFRDFEAILIDDASDDRTYEIARAFADLHPGRYVARRLEQNAGRAARVRNIALDACDLRGRYVLFLDGDDAIEPDFLFEMARAAREKDADIAVCLFDRADEITRAVSAPEPQWLAKAGRIDARAGDLAFLNTALWNKLIRRELIADTRMTDLLIGEDAVFLWTLYDKCGAFALVPHPLIHYRVRGNSAMARASMPDIAAFAGALRKAHHDAVHPVMKETLALAAFIHIGLSMGLRALNASDPPIAEYVAWARREFRDGYGGDHPARPFVLRACLRHGKNGPAVLAAMFAYRLGLGAPFLKALRRLTSRAGKSAFW